MPSKPNQIVLIFNPKQVKMFFKAQPGGGKVSSQYFVLTSIQAKQQNDIHEGDGRILALTMTIL